MSKDRDTIFPQPFYYLGFSITDEEGKPCQFQTLFSDEKSSLKYALEHEPGGFRFGGWSLPKNAPYSITLDGLEFKNEIWRIKVREDGHILIQVAVSEGYLSWASSDIQSTVKGERTLINTTALVEFTYNCVAFLKRALQDTQKAETVRCEFGFVGMDANYVLGDNKLPDPSPIKFHRQMNPIGASTETTLEITAQDVLQEDGPAIFSYSILTKIYRMFGYTDDVISYVHSTEKKIDIELIKGIK